MFPMPPPPSDLRPAAALFMRRAIELARRGMAAGDGGPFGAVVVRGDTIVGEGWNRVVGGNDPTAHGEIVAIRDACRRLGSFSLAGCELYTTGEPCPMCLAASYWARLDHIYYGFGITAAAACGFADVHFYRELAKPRETRELPVVQLLEEEARRLLGEFQALPDRARY